MERIGEHVVVWVQTEPHELVEPGWYFTDERERDGEPMSGARGPFASRDEAVEAARGSGSLGAAARADGEPVPVPDAVRRTAKAIWTAQGGVPRRFDLEWNRDATFRVCWSGYAEAVRAAVLEGAEERPAADGPGKGASRYAIDYVLSEDSMREDHPEPGFYVVDTECPVPFNDVVARFLRKEKALEYCAVMNAREASR